MEKGSGNMKAKICLRLVGPEWLPAVWGKLADYMEAALAHSCQYEWTGAELYRRLVEGEFRLMAVFRSVGAYEIIGGVVCSRGVRDGRPYLAVVCCGGRDMDDWIDDAVAGWFALARSEGADEIVVMGRQGWLRRLARHGLKQRAVIAAAPVPASSDVEADRELVSNLGVM